MARHNKVGKWGEDLATRFLITKGYTIRETNWKKDCFEIDIIAMKGSRIVFVEVKTRSAKDINPESAVDRKKMRKMVNAANAYVRMFNIPHEIQYDIISINGSEDEFEIEHFEDAFLAPLKTYR